VGVQKDIDADGVDDPVVGGPQLQDPLTQLRIRGQRLDRRVEQLLDGGLGVGCVGFRPLLGVGVDGVDQVAHDLAHRHTGDAVQPSSLSIGKLQLQGGQA